MKPPATGKIVLSLRRGDWMSASTELTPGRIQYVVVCGVDLTGLSTSSCCPGW
jgi:hypothetical protein